tara:strand:+ start:85 stop:726 length:642 start_codon:yes stop_codon:yes gene_type:complete
MQIKTFQGGFDKNFSYLIWCEKTKIASIVDPAVQIHPMVETINQYNLILDKILITHTHHDHIFYLDDFKYLFPNIEIICSNITYNEINEFYGVEHKEIIPIGEELIIALHTPGHFYNSICYWHKKKNLLFTGDTMFVGRSGRTKDKRSNIKDLYNSIYNVILNLPENTMIYPGHHYGYVKAITIKDNIVCSKFFNCKNFEEFNDVMINFESKR